MKIKESEPPHCVQCAEEMPYGTDWDKFVPVCHNHKCPNYGLLQMGIEKMRGCDITISNCNCAKGFYGKCPHKN